MVTGLFRNNCERTFYQRLWFLLCHVNTVFHGITVIMMSFSTTKLTPVEIGSFIMNMLTVIHRYFLCRYSSQLGLVAQRLSSYTMKEDKGFVKQTYLLLCSCIGYSVISLVSSIFVLINSFKNSGNQNRFEELLGADPNFVAVSLIMVSINYMVCFAMPVNTFIIYYVSVCHDIELLFQEYTTRMLSQSVPDYQCLTKRYNHLRNLVLEVDKHINCIVFWAALSNLFSLYFTIAGMMASTSMLKGESVCIITAVVYNTFMFFLMCLWADRVSCSASSVAHAAHFLRGNSISSVMHIRYILAVSQDVHMSVWGLFPLRKSFVFASIGTMITYSVLIKDIIKQ
ncbi:hypothetical protein AVEN_196220-1 [Araneus ventricosus]|uniref:Odorant receptor n=1 Tax=Araneus ventricosus TaxID=182803 RepID=A0A4Y2FK52_ARAVE|nr:hypothetical protein AVEN_196220-1 [Araneus ventricosus]